MRDHDEIQRAHDLITASMDGLPFPEQVGFTVVLDCLCWVLEHEHPTAMTDHLVALLSVREGEQVH